MVLSISVEINSQIHPFRVFQIDRNAGRYHQRDNICASIGMRNGAGGQPISTGICWLMHTNLVYFFFFQF